MAHLLGIDLGTTTTIVARIGADGAPELVRDWEGEPITPTAVAFETVNHVVVGREARAMADDGEHVFLEFKRDLGTGVSHPALGRRVTPLDLSALMLRKVREHAEAAHGPVDLAVITIPANFTNAAREATLEACNWSACRWAGAVWCSSCGLRACSSARPTPARCHTSRYATIAKPASSSPRNRYERRITLRSSSGAWRGRGGWCISPGSGSSAPSPRAGSTSVPRSTARICSTVRAAGMRKATIARNGVASERFATRM